MGQVEKGCYVVKERSANGARFVTLLPKMALKRFEIGNLDVATHKIIEVCLKFLSGIPILLGEGIAILCKGWAIPFLVQDFGKSFHGVWKLKHRGMTSVSQGTERDGNGARKRKVCLAGKEGESKEQSQGRAKVGEGIQEAGVFE